MTWALEHKVHVRKKAAIIKNPIENILEMLQFLHLSWKVEIESLNVSICFMGIRYRKCIAFVWVIQAGCQKV